jgi:cobalt transporter subunit CbtA
MSVFRSIVFSAVVVGVVVGIVVTIAQHVGTVPLILKAEVYEHAANKAVVDHATAAIAAHHHAEGEPGEAAWQPSQGLQRNSLTAVANILTAIGFALLLAGIYALRSRTVTWHEGLLWGLGGFVVFTAAPGLGLPPELPGGSAAPLEPRQIWWIATAASTASGLILLVFRHSPWAAVLGLCLVALPHLIGAPQFPEAQSNVPDALSHQFIVAVTLTSLLSWVLLGSLTSIVYRNFSSRGAPNF